MVSASLRRLDAFSPVTSDLSRATTTGGAFTLFAAFLCSVLFLQLVRGFFFEEPENTVRLLDPGAFTIDINLDILMWDVPCEYVGVGVWDVLGADLVSRKTDLEDAITTDNMKGGMGAYSDDEVDVLEEFEAVRPDEGNSADTGGTSSDVSSDRPAPLAITSMSEVTTLADYVFVAFSVDWCPYCKRLQKPWEEFALTEANLASKNSRLYRTAVDSEGKKVTFRVVTVSCETSEVLCRAEGVDSYPTIRVYYKKKFAEMHPGPPSTDRFIEFAKELTRQHHKIDPHSVKHRRIFAKGCRVKGTLSVPAVPGVVKIGPKAHMPRLNKTVNPHLVNVSHRINHFSFGYSKKASSWATGLIGRESAPMDGMVFGISNFHQAPIHHLSVVSTVTSSQQSVFKMAHTHRIASLGREETPLVQFKYDLSPIEVVHFSEEMTVYNFFTSVFAVVGGTYAVMGLVSQFLTQM